VINDLVGLCHRDASGLPPTRQSVTGIPPAVNENDLFLICAEGALAMRQGGAHACTDEQAWFSDSHVKRLDRHCET